MIPRYISANCKMDRFPHLKVMHDLRRQSQLVLQTFSATCSRSSWMLKNDTFTVYKLDCSLSYVRWRWLWANFKICSSLKDMRVFSIRNSTWGDVFNIHCCLLTPVLNHKAYNNPPHLPRRQCSLVGHQGEYPQRRKSGGFSYRLCPARGENELQLSARWSVTMS